ncbi:MAG: fructosamine kinase family protein [Anaerolineae bacterium]|nr:fructosamine kinase family protein [Anaerolineae bacterium]
MLNAISAQLLAAGASSPVRRASPVGGGDINEAALVETTQACYFVKWHRNPPPGFFEGEADGLQRLAASGAIRVPWVIGAGAAEGASFLILEWIERGGKTPAAAELLGRQLAALHRPPLPAFGLDRDNTLGTLPQPNTPRTSWMAFYRDQRLGVQRDLAARNGLLPAERARRLDRLMGSLDHWINEAAVWPALLHGDLWGGNWIVSADGGPVLIDPAVYAGDREMDLAMASLFGGFPERFFAAYAEALPLPPGAAERQPLYQLYYLLCHLNLFGEGYGGPVDRILHGYAPH